MAAPNSPRKRRISVLRDLLMEESLGGYVLMAAAAAGLVLANSGWASSYFAVLKIELPVGIGRLTLTESVLHWINDGLMALFFLLVGLEIKREVLEGQLSSRARLILPGVAALGGVLTPALIYFLVAGGAGPAARGWAIPTATDIAFALGLLALLGSRVPVSLKIFVTAIAILDDLAAIVIIALFYAGALDMLALAAAAGIALLLIALNRLRVVQLLPYLVLGVVLWVCVLKSGIHATLAGVVLALTIPLRATVNRGSLVPSPLHRLEHWLQKPVALLIVPIFGFANAGVSFAGVGLGTLGDPVPLGILLGLFFGKQLGIFLFASAAIRLKVAEMPGSAGAAQLYGVALLCGIGFTMSLFIGNLAFGTSPLMDETKIGVLAGSLLSAAGGVIVLMLAREKPD